jgi:hypothetical protein
MCSVMAYSRACCITGAILHLTAWCHVSHCCCVCISCSIFRGLDQALKPVLHRDRGVMVPG